MKIICYCADDYALNEQISTAILKLLESNIIQATSCMTQSPLWSTQAPLLRQLRKHIVHSFDLGLHINFTHPFNHPSTFNYPLSKLMFKAWTRSLDATRIRQSLEQQWDLFIQEIGTPPDFIDGHQHIHQFPIIRDVLFQFLAEKNFKGWIRNLEHCIPASPYLLKTKLLEHLGAHKTKQLADQYQITSNPYFAGIYDFKTESYAQLNQQWLKGSEQALLIMCHPAVALPQEFDEIQEARIQEYKYFNSAQFLQDCQNFHVQRQPMSTIL